MAWDDGSFLLHCISMIRYSKISLSVYTEVHFASPAGEAKVESLYNAHAVSGILYFG